MKKKIGLFFSVIFGCFILTSFSPSLDGRAIVANEGEMPQGVFAKTVGYLPGDSIGVTNLTNKTTIDVLVIGALDPSEGVAILLSPEAAKLLNIEKDSNHIVKITKRSGQLDQAVSGTAVIGSVPESETTAKTEEVAKEEPKVEEVAPVVPPVAEEPEVTEPEKAPETEVATEPEVTPEPEVVAEEKPAEVQPEATEEIPA